MKDSRRAQKDFSIMEQCLEKKRRIWKRIIGKKKIWSREDL